jgi:hypothetical protein
MLTPHRSAVARHQLIIVITVQPQAHQAQSLYLVARLHPKRFLVLNDHRD